MVLKSCLLLHQHLQKFVASQRPQLVPFILCKHPPRDLFSVQGIHIKSPCSLRYFLLGRQLKLPCSGMKPKFFHLAPGFCSMSLPQMQEHLPSPVVLPHLLVIPSVYSKQKEHPLLFMYLPGLEYNKLMKTFFELYAKMMIRRTR